MKKKSESIQVADLQQVLKLLKEFTTSRRTVVPALSCFLFEPNEISASSGDAGCRSWVPFSCMSPFLLQAERLVAVVNSFPGDLQLSFRVGQSAIELRAGEFFAQFQKMRVEDFPKMPDQTTRHLQKQQKGAQEMPVEFVTGVDRIGFSIGADQMKPQLTGVGVQEGKVLASSDSYRISKYEMKKKVKWEGTLPPRIARMLAASELALREGALLSPDGSACWAWIGEEVVAFQVKHIADFPSVKPFFEEAKWIWKSGIRIDLSEGQRENLLLALDRLFLFTEGDVNRIIEVYSAKGGLRIVVNPKGINPALIIPADRAEEFVPAKWKGDTEFSFWVSGPLFRQAVERSSVFFYKDDKHPLYFTDEEGFEHILLLIGKH